MAGIWIRRDRETGELSEVSEAMVKYRLQGLYKNLTAALAGANEQLPLTAGFADYWPKMISPRNPIAGRG